MLAPRHTADTSGGRHARLPESLVQKALGCVLEVPEKAKALTYSPEKALSNSLISKKGQTATKEVSTNLVKILFVFKALCHGLPQQGVGHPRVLILKHLVTYPGEQTQGEASLP